MCARRQTSAMSKSFLCCDRPFCRSIVVMCRGGEVTWSSVVWDEAVWRHLAEYYSSTSLYHKVKLCTTTYYSSTTPVLQTTTPVLLCTTENYSSTTLYYKVLPQYYSVLQSITQVLVCTTKYYSSTTSSSHMKHHLPCAEQNWLLSNITKYCACHAKWISWLIRGTYATSVPMRGATRVILQTHQVLRLPRNSDLQISAETLWIASANIKRLWPWSERGIVISHPPLRWPYSSDLRRDFRLQNTRVHGPAISQNFTKCGACHAKWHNNYSLGIYSLSIYSLLASILYWHLFSKHLFSFGIYSLLASSL